MSKIAKNTKGAISCAIYAQFVLNHLQKDILNFAETSQEKTKARACHFITR